MLLLFFLFWVIFNGAVTVEIVVFGVVIALLVFAFACKFMDYSVQKEKRLMKKSGYFLYYVGVLILEILKANLAVLRLLLSQREIVDPVMVSFRTDLQSRVARLILANSITLTPGTITVSMQGDQLVVHCLDRTLSEGMEDSIFVQMLRKLERIGE